MIDQFLQPDDQTAVVSAKFDGLVDVIDDNGELKYLIVDQDDPETSIVWINSEDVLVPPRRREIPWAVPRADKVAHYLRSDLDELLFDDLVRWIKDASELPSEYHYDLLATWIMHTYLMEHFNYSPIISLYSVADRGKTRTGKALAFTAYRGLHVETLNPAFILRASSKAQNTFFFDVVDIWATAKRKGSEDILLSRFERGAKSARTQNAGNGSFLSTDYYDLFAPTVIAINEPPHHVLESRSITINMRPTTRRFQTDVTMSGSADLRDRLTAFRTRHLLHDLPYVDKVCAGRLGDITRPLIQIAQLVKPAAVDRLMSVINEVEESRRLELCNDLEAGLIRAVAELSSEAKNRIIPIKKITDFYNKSVSARDRVTYQLVGRRLGSLGFKKKTLGGNVAGIVVDEFLITNQMLCFGLITPQTPQTQLAASVDIGF